MSPDLVRRVRDRAGGCCEYCWLPASAQFLPFHIDHVIARQHGGGENLENLALACVHCNRFKGPNIAGFDTETNQVVRLFHPRTDLWSQHFNWAGAWIEATTAIGRVTVRVLYLNDPQVVLLREALARERDLA